jgi:hypothetical protein
VGEPERTAAEVVRYPALMTIRGVIGVLAWVVIIVGLGATIVGMIEGFDDSFLHGLWILLLGVATTILYAVVLFAIGEGIKVVVDIEENTRRG